jgi:hypothetical protein
MAGRDLDGTSATTDLGYPASGGAAAIAGTIGTVDIRTIGISTTGTTIITMAITTKAEIATKATIITKAEITTKAETTTKAVPTKAAVETKPRCTKAVGTRVVGIKVVGIKVVGTKVVVSTVRSGPSLLHA